MRKRNEEEMCREEVTVERPLAVVVDDLVGLLLEELDGGEALHLGRGRKRRRSE